MIKINNKKIEKRLIVSSVTHDHINSKFFDVLINMKKKLRAELEVYGTRLFYKNDHLLDEKYEQYLAPRSRKVCEKLRILGDLNTNEFTDSPGTGLKYRGESFVIPHPTHRLQMMERRIKRSKFPALIACTGSINHTPDNYRNKTEYRGTQNWLTGALYIEIYFDGTFSLTQLAFDGKGVQLMNKYFTSSTVTNKHADLVLGDLHPGEECEYNMKGVYWLIKTLKPKDIVLHDWFDGHSISHHIQFDTLARSNSQSLIDEARVAARLIGEIRDRSGANIHLVASNHPEHVERWLKEPERWARDVVNVEIGSELNLELIKGRCIFKKLLSKFIKLVKINILKRGDLLTINKRKCENHGDWGKNGARSSANSKQPEDTEAHTHTPDIGANGSITVGTSTKLTLSYTNESGSSTWANAHCISYPNGKAGLIFIV